SDPVPGGGSAAALAGAMGASLVCMVAGLTIRRGEYAEAEPMAHEIGEAAGSLRDELVALAEQDSQAYQAFVSARRLPRENDEQRALRGAGMGNAIVGGAEVPVGTARVALKA